MKKTVITNGLILGAILSVIFLAFHFTNPRLNFDTSIGLIISIVIPVILMRKGIIEERKLNDGILTFGEAMSVAFPIFAIGTFLALIVQYAVMQLDPNYFVIAQEVMTETVEKSMALLEKYTDLEPEAKEQAMQEIQNNPPNMGIGTVIMGYMVQLIFPGAIIAMILSAVLKKSN